MPTAASVPDFTIEVPSRRFGSRCRKAGMFSGSRSLLTIRATMVMRALEALLQKDLAQAKDDAMPGVGIE